MFKLKNLIKISIAVYLAVALVVIVCLFKISYEKVDVTRVQVLEIKHASPNGVLAICRYFPDGSGNIPVGNKITRIEGVGSGVSCYLDGRIIRVGNQTADRSQSISIYIEGLQYEDILRRLIEISRYENIDVDGGKEPLFKKLIGQLLWKQKFH